MRHTKAKIKGSKKTRKKMRGGSIANPAANQDQMRSIANQLIPRKAQRSSVATPAGASMATPAKPSIPRKAQLSTMSTPAGPSMATPAGGGGGGGGGGRRQVGSG